MTHGTDYKIVISWTTTSYRTDICHEMVRSIVSGVFSPDNFILWVSPNADSQYDEGIDEVPDNLQEYVDNGDLEVRFIDEDYGSFTKLRPALKEFWDEDVYIVTVDDDFVYDKFFLARIVKKIESYRDFLVGYRAKLLMRHDDGTLKSYNDMPVIYHDNHLNDRKEYIVNTGGGAAFHPRFFDDEIFDEEKRVSFAPYADDLWVTAMLRKNSVPLKLCNINPAVRHVDVQKEFTLWHTRNRNGGNDEVLESLERYYAYKK